MKKIVLFETNNGQMFESETEVKKYLQSLINIGIKNMAEEIRDLEGNEGRIANYIKENLNEFYRIIELKIELDEI